MATTADDMDEVEGARAVAATISSASASASVATIFPAVGSASACAAEDCYLTCGVNLFQSLMTEGTGS